MSWTGSGIISTTEERRVAGFLALQGSSTPLAPADLNTYCDISTRKARVLLEHLASLKLVAALDLPRCSSCDVAVLRNDADPDDVACDLCHEIPTETDRFYFVSDARAFGSAPKDDVPMTDASFSATRLAAGRIKPWGYLQKEDFIVERTKMDDETESTILQRLETHGFVLLRLGAITPSQEMLTALENSLGDALLSQNDFEGKIKPIFPKPGVVANTGDSAAELGPHVDGTQNAPLPPAILAFHYYEGATVGGHSTFIDMVDVLLGMAPETREQILIDLAQIDAGTCRKVKKREGMADWVGEYRGALVRTVCNDQAVSIRVRFDDPKDGVLTVSSQAQASLEKFKLAVMSRGQDQRIQYVAREGDIAIFDNWRILHGRTAVSGKHQRHHDRFWIKELAARHRSKYLLGVRGLSLGVLHSIKQANDGRV